MTARVSHDASMGTADMADSGRRRPGMDASTARAVRLVEDCAEVMIEQARTGQSPDVALRLLGYFIYQASAQKSRRLP
jgi:hypothetical protein